MKRLLYINLVIFVLAGTILGLGLYYFSFTTKKFDNQTEANLKEAKRIFDAMPVWHKKIPTKQILKFGIATDNHVNSSRINSADRRPFAPRKLRSSDYAFFSKFVPQMKEFQPEFVVNLGDVVDGSSDPEPEGIIELQLVRKEMEKAGVPVKWVVGNHDLRVVSKEKFGEVLDMEAMDYTFDIGDYRFVVVDANYDRDNVPRSPDGGRYIPGHIPPQTFEWLKKQLETDKRVIVFIHQGVFADKSRGDYSKEKQKFAYKKSINNADELQKIFDEYRVDASFNGHMEARRYEKTNRWTHCYSLTGAKKSKDYPHSYYEVTLKNGVPDVTMFYTPPGTYKEKQVDFETDVKPNNITDLDLIKS